MTPPTAVDRLIEYVASDPAHDALRDELRRWLAGSSRFRAFAERYRDKIRRKLRGAADADADALADVRAELAVAQRLSADRHLELAWEAAGSQRGGPDFRVTYRRSEKLELEVTRVRRGLEPVALEATLLAKLQQLPTGTANLLLLAAAPVPGRGADATVASVDAAVRSLRARADAKDEAFFTARRFRNARGFYDRFLRLGGVIAWVDGAEARPTAELWRNPSARIALPARAARAILIALRA